MTTRSAFHPTAPARPVARTILVVVVVAGLAVDAVLHVDLAARYEPVRTSVLSQADLAAVLLVTVLSRRSARTGAAARPRPGPPH